MKRFNNSPMDIALAVVLSSLIIAATMATIIQMQKDMLAYELVTQLSSSYKPQAPLSPLCLNRGNRQTRCNNSSGPHFPGLTSIDPSRYEVERL